MSKGDRNGKLNKTLDNHNPYRDSNNLNSSKLFTLPDATVFKNIEVNSVRHT